MAEKEMHVYDKGEVKLGTPSQDSCNILEMEPEEKPLGPP